MRLIVRLSRFASIGILSTLVHYLGLVLFLFIGLELWISNLFAFTFAFMLSFSWQQKYTFGDRLGSDSRLNQKALILLYLLNLIFAGVFARLMDNKFALLLPLLPAACNYILFYISTGLRLFKKKA